MAFAGQAVTKFSNHGFKIVSKLNGMVLDIEASNKSEGTKIIMYDENYGNTANQLWCTDEHGFITSCLNGMSFCAPSVGEPLRMSSMHGPEAKWKIDGDKIRNEQGLYLDIIGANKSKGAEICAYPWNGCDHQRWIIKQLYSPPNVLVYCK